MRKIFRHLHLWISIPFGLVIVVICFTGALLVFEKEITNIVTSNMRTVEQNGSCLSMGQLVDMVSKTLPEGVKVKGVTVSCNPDEAYKITLSKPRHAAVFVNQYTGEITGKYERLPFFRTTMRLHRWLMDKNPGEGGVFWGKIVVGISTIAFVLLLFTGFIVWWPRNRKMLKNRLNIVFSKGKNRLWYDLHVAGGFYVSVLLLAIALTGLTWSFKWYNNAFYDVVAGKEAVVKKENSARGEKKERNVTSGSEIDVWQKAFDNVVAENPDFNQVTVSDGTVTLSKKYLFGNYRASDRYGFDRSNGDIVSETLYKDSDRRSKARGWVYSIHTGLWGGLFSQLLTFFAALLGATLPLTGYYFWIKRLYGKRKK